MLSRCLHILGARPLIRRRKRTSTMSAIVTTDELGWGVNHQIAVAHASCTNKRSAMSFPCSAFVGASSRAEDDDDVDATKSLSRRLSVYNSNIGSWAKCDESRHVLKRMHPAHPDQVIAVKVGTVPASGPIMRIRVSRISISANDARRGSHPRSTQLESPTILLSMSYSSNDDDEDYPFHNSMKKQ